MDVHATSAQVTVASGATFSNQVEFLSNRCTQLIGEGSKPQDVVVFAASPDAACTLRQAIAHTDAANVLVTTPFQFALKILKDPGFAQFSGRHGRVLEPQDTNMLLEDVKTGGIRTGKLRSMLRFFDRTLANLEDEGLWFKTQDDMDTFGIMRKRLDVTGGILPSEVCNLAWRFLTATPNSNWAFGQAWSFSHVLVSDFQNLNRSSQALACALARNTLTVYSDPAASCVVFDLFPYAQGGADLLASNASACTLDLDGGCKSARFARVESMLRTEAAGEGRSPFLANPFPDVPEPVSSDDLQIRSCTNESDEIAHAARQIHCWLDEGVNAQDILVITPHPLWTANLEKVLSAKGVPVAKRTDYAALTCDIRDFSSAETARIHTLLQLAADPEDLLAWRAWVGYGDWLANSEEMLYLVKRVSEASSDALGSDSTVDSITHAAQPHAATSPISAADLYASTSHASAISDAFALGTQAIAELNGKTGMNLLRAAAFCITGKDDVPASLLRMYSTNHDGHIDEACDPAALMAIARDKVFAPKFVGEGLRVTDVRGAYGRSWKAVLWMGFANGFIPGHDYFDNVASSDLQQQREWLSDCRRILSVLLSTSQQLVCTYPSHISAPVAERCGALAARIQLVDRKKVFLQTPSEFVRVLQA